MKAKWWMFFLGIFIFIVLAQMASNFPSSEITTPAPTQARIPLPVIASRSRKAIYIENTGDADLTGRPLTVILNFDSDHVKAVRPAPAPGRTLAIRLDDFEKDGTRFNPAVRMVKDVFVGCEMDMGNPRYSARGWTF